ncbi:MAG: prenyltransferase [Pyrinomonadaceae bacterium]
MPDWRFLLKVSRPRFWLYVLGPYLVGLAAGAASTDDLLRIEVLVFGLYFLLPANLLIYGINDIFDFETDRKNPKKAEYEMLVRPESHRKLLIWMITLNLPFAAASIYIAPQAIFSLAGFFFFSIFYSAPPIRAKQVPFLDSAFNVLYVFPGAFAYQMLTGSFPPLLVFAAAWCWTMAMHAYSAIPDIGADRTAGVNTVATLLGPGWTHLFCGLLFAAASILSVTRLTWLSAIAGLIYVPLMRFSDLAKYPDGVVRIYKIFPILNAVVGFALFWYVAWPKFF